MRHRLPDGAARCWPFCVAAAAARRTWSRRVRAIAPPRETAGRVRDAGRHAAAVPDLAAGWRAWAVVLALHGMNDSRDAWEYPAPELAAHGVAVFAPDQRGFGDTAVRGYWPGTQALVDDARAMARAAAPALSACAADPDGREHGRRGADVPRDRAGSAAGGRLRAGGARGVGAGGDERVPAHRRCGCSPTWCPASR